MMKNIPIFKLSKRSESGIEVRRLQNGFDEDGLELYHYLDDGNADGHKDSYAHRGDNYSFLYIERGHGSINIDFKVVQFIENDIYFIAPGQVHHEVMASECHYWHISAASALIPKEYFDVFERASLLQAPQNLGAGESEQCLAVLRLLSAQFVDNRGSVYYKQMTQELLQVFLCAVARKYIQFDAAGSVSRLQQITRDFSKQLKEHMRVEKSSARYAEMLNISEAYLSEAVKKTTGFTVGLLIRDAVILEAQRLLRYTEMTVKEIAHDLGYEDHTYFYKLFLRATGATPLEFRGTHLE